MCKAAVFAVLLGSVVAGGPASEPNGPAAAPCCTGEQKAASPVDKVLEQLQKRISDLTSYRCSIDYVVAQPLLESSTRRKGTLYYARFDDRSYLRVDFRTLQQDEESEQPYRQQFIFDGVWLTSIDYPAETVERRQMAEPNRPVDAFALINRHVPVFGFSKVEDLRKHFEIELVAQEQTEPSAVHHLHLVTKDDSAYKEDYTTVDFWIDTTSGLPGKVIAVGAEADIGDVYTIHLLDGRVNERIGRDVFDVKPPPNFPVETVLLERDKKG